MIYSLPADTVVTSIDELPTGLVGDLGVQIQRTSNGTVILGRTINGIVERPANSGNYVITFTAPVEEDAYLIVVDWSAGVLDPATTRVRDLNVSTSIPVDPSGLGAIADAAKTHMGETFDALQSSPHIGAAGITAHVEVIKARVMTDPPAQGDEAALHKLVIDYLGKLVVLALIPAAIDYWAQQPVSEAIGNDPVEQTTYSDRIKAMEKVQEALLLQTRRDESMIIPMLSAPRLRPSSDGPAIDEPEDARVMADPRDFSPYEDYPNGGRRRRSTGVMIP